MLAIYLWAVKTAGARGARGAGERTGGGQRARGGALTRALRRGIIHVP